MRMRADEARRAGRPWRPAWHWIAYRRISPVLVRAVLVTEDSRFWEHEGIDLDEMKMALETSWEYGTAPRGASA